MRWGSRAQFAAVVAGLIIGNRTSVPTRTRQHLEDFWELVDETLNSVLFLLVGLVILQMRLSRHELPLPLLAIAIVLFARWVSVWCSVSAVSDVPPAAACFAIAHGWFTDLGWTSRRVALAMALSLPLQPDRDRLISAVFGVVVFSILIQGSTLPRVFRYWLPAADPANSRQVPNKVSKSFRICSSDHLTGSDMPDNNLRYRAAKLYSVTIRAFELMMLSKVAPALIRIRIICNRSCF